jgi:hypothetical protein
MPPRLLYFHAWSKRPHGMPVGLSISNCATTLHGSARMRVAHKVIVGSRSERIR